MAKITLVTIFACFYLFTDAQIPIDSLVGYYPLDGNSLDYSGWDNNGVMHGAVSASNRFGEANMALHFNGINEYIAVPSSNSLNPTNQLTISVWVKIDTLTNRYTPIIHKGGVGNNNFTNREYLIYLDAVGKIFSESSGDDGFPNYFGTVFPGYHKWFLYTTVIDRVNHKMISYINGEKVAEIADSYSDFTINSDSIRIASWEESNSEYSDFFTGSLDDLQFYRAALDSQQIKFLYEETNFHRFYDSLKVNQTVYDTVIVTDTLVINVSTANVNNKLIPAEFIVYPNPTKDKLLIINDSYDKFRGCHLKIFNCNGQEIFNSLIDKRVTEINFQLLGDKGIYFLHIVDPESNDIAVKKVVLQ